MKISERMIFDLGDIHPSMLSLVGGKALNLGLLTRGAFPVPRGFCLSTAAYAEACGREPVSTLVDELAAAGPSPGGRAAALARGVRQAITEGVIPDAAESAIRSAYAALGADTAVAVRSSADAEDLPSASFAGQQETLLNVVGIDPVLTAVRRCWSSLWTDRAVSYRARMGLDHRSVRMAVIIQTLVRAQVSGVLFTANPLTGRRHEAVIDANFGLGESVVSGAVNPDHFVISLPGGGIRERTRGDKLLQVRSLRDGGVERRARSDAEDRLCLTDEQAGSLARMGERVEQLLGGPQDIEWAIDGSGGIWLTQARAITTLFPVPPRLPGESGDLRVYYSVNASQGMEQPLTPLGSSLLRLLVSAVAGSLGFPPPDPFAGPSFMKEAAGRLFLDVTRALRSSPGRGILLAMTATAEARAGSAMRGLAQKPAFSLNYNDLLPFVLRGVIFLVRFHILFRLARSLVNPGKMRAGIRALGGRLQHIARLPPYAGPDARLCAIVELFSPKTVGRLLTIMPVTAVPGMACISLAGKLLGSLATAGELEEVQRGLADNFTTEMGLELYRIAAQIPPEERPRFLETSPEKLSGQHRDGSLPHLVQQALDSFLTAYGHRCAAELDGGLPRWSEDPSPVFAMIANFIRGPVEGRAPDTMFRESFETAESLVQELVRRARGRGRVRAGLVLFCLRRARSLLGFREAPRFYIAMQLDLCRKILLPVGEQLVSRSLLAARDDLSFLSLNEVFQCLAGKDFRSAVAARRESHERDMARRAPAVLLSDGSVPETEEHAPVSSHTVLHGVAASAGTATGPARVILDPARSHVDPGEILVAPSTDPGWTPLFLTAGALVTETGGPMAHGAIVAREYGIPAVVAVPGATQRIRSGMRITVDGSNGTVTIESESIQQATMPHPAADA